MKKITLTKTFNPYLLRLMFCFFLFLGLSDVVHGQIAYTQDFSTTTHGWSTGIARSTTNICATTASLRKNLYSGASTGTTTSPTVGASNGGLITMTYYYKIIDYATGNAATPNTFGNFSFQYSTNNTTWYDVPNSMVSTDHVPSTDCVQKTLTFSAPPSTAFYIRLNAVWATGDYWLHFDDVAISQGAAPTCIMPTGLAASSITTSAATISWTASTSTPAEGYEYYYATSNTAPTSTTVPTGSTAAGIVTKNITGLSDNTQYYVWVRSKCSSTDTSAWSPASTFRTLCLPTASFSENFDGLTATGLIPSCWSKVLSGAVATATVGTSTTTPNSGTYSIAMYNVNSTATSNIMLVSPVLSNLSAGTHRLKFYARNTSATQDIQVGTMTNPADATTFTMLSAVDINTTWTEYTVSFAAYTGTNTYIAIRRLSTSTYTYVYLDDIKWEAIPTAAPGCATNVVATTNTTCGNSATSITWSAMSGVDGYKVSVGTTSGGTDLVNNQTVNTTSFSYVGNVATTYYVTVVPFNNIGNATSCTSISFTTLATGCYCTSVPTSNDDFGITNVQLVTDDFPNTDVTYFDHTATVVDAQIGVNTNLKITFDTGYSYDTHVWIDFNDNFAFEASEKVFTGVSTSDSPTILDASFLMPASAPAGVHRMRIGSADSGQATPNPCYSGAYGVTLDFKVNLFAPPTCLPPAAITVSSLTSSGATISWTAPTTTVGEGYDYYFATINTAPTSTTIANGSTAASVLTANLTGLFANTQYYLWMRSRCSATDTSSWSPVLTFKTPCVAVTEYFENFDSATAGSTAALIDCWSKLGTTGSSYITTSSITPASIPNRWYLYGFNGTAAYIHTPEVSNLAANTHRLRFKAYATSTNRSLEVGYLTTQNDVSTFTLIQNVAMATTTAATIQQYSIVPGALPTGVSRLVLRITTPAGDFTSTTVYVDDVIWEAIPTTPPTCPEISSPSDMVENVLDGTVSWVPSLDATSYIIKVGTTPNGSEILDSVNIGNVSFYNFPTDVGTTYWVKVTATNQYGTSTGCTTFSFTTCDALFAPYIETFNIFMPTCWSNRYGGDLATGPAPTGNSGWTGDGFGNVGSSGAIRNEIWTTGANDWVISPLVNIPSSGFELKFDAAATQYFSTNAPTTPWESDDKIEVLVSTNNLSWTSIYTFDSSNQPSNTGTTTILDLDTYANQNVRFAFRALEGDVNDGADIDFFIDNFEVRMTPTTPPVCPTNLVATVDTDCGNDPTTLTWTAASGADGYKVTIGTTQTGTNVLNAVDIGNVQTYSFSGTPGTTYYVTIVSYNVVGSATGCSTISFSTNSVGCVCPSVPTSVDGDGITNVQLGTTNFPNTDVTYFDHSATVVDSETGDLMNLQITFATGFTYGTNVWVDLNDNYTFESSELLYSGVSLSDDPTTLNASFTMPATAPVGIHRMRIGTADSGQATPNPCYSGSWGVTLDFKVNVVSLKNDTFDDANFVYYPNPVTDILNVSYIESISKVQVLNLLGQEVMVKSINATQSQVDMSNLASGTYLVKVTADDKVKTIKVIKK